MAQLSSPPFIQAENLSQLPGIRHGFFSRHGGVSKAPYDSLNTGLGSNDLRTNVDTNRARCARALAVQDDHLLTVHQVHSPHCVNVTGPWHEEVPQVDAMVTRTPGLALGVLAADCMPFLFADPVAKIIGAAHAGWRGALAGVLEGTVEAMVAQGADTANIHAALGPCLRQPNFEVGLDLVEAFTSKYPEADIFFSDGKSADKRQFNLAGFGLWRLRTVGIDHLSDLDRCTLGAPTSYFSYRHSRQTGASDYGRNLSAIVLTDTPD